MEVKELVTRYPRLYHMAERDTWPSIKKIGLLSTSAILDRYGVTGRSRVALERRHRPEKVYVGPPGNRMILRDQKPMAPERIKKALPPNVTPAQWYRVINKLVFMWAERDRLLILLQARPYRNLEHDVLTIDTEQFVRCYEPKIWLAHMNSGNTFPVPHKRNLDLFQRITDYPTKKSGVPVKNVVEVVTDYAIPDIHRFVVAVDRMRGESLIRHIAP